MLGILNTVNNFLWNGIGLWLLIFAGIFLSLTFKFFQLRLPFIFKKTVGSLFGGRRHDTVSPFAAVCTALGATVGVGNIAGVASAITLGGPGAVFWMLAAALLGMITAYTEDALAVFYRKREGGEWRGGAMIYLRDGLGAHKGFKAIAKVFAIIFSAATVAASFGIGNAAQIKAVCSNFPAAFPISGVGGIRIFGADLYSLLLASAVAVAAGCVILGGARKTATLAERLVPAMVALFVLGALAVIFFNYFRLLPAITAIFKFAFSGRAAAGGAVGYTVRSAISYGFKRGVFSHEAGMGSATIISSAADTREPAEQGMWGMFQVFVDTVVMCTLTALCVLCSGLVDLKSGAPVLPLSGERLVSEAFSLSFGDIGAAFIAVSVLLFTFSSIVGWSYFGCRAWEFLFGKKSAFVYKWFFIAFIVPAAALELDSVWTLCDLSNALMILPNLSGVLLLSPVAVKLTHNYLARERGEKLPPMRSFYPEIEHFLELK